MKTVCIALLSLALLSLGLAAAAHAEARVYELSVPAVQCSFSSEKAENTARQVAPGLYAKGDPEHQKITVRFEDEQTSIDAIATALAGQGYPVKSRKQLR